MAYLFLAVAIALARLALGERVPFVRAVNAGSIENEWRTLYAQRMSDSPRALLPRLAAERGLSLTELSVRIGRNQAYLQQFIARGSPRRLPETERRHLAMTLNIDERLLGARDPWSPPA